MDEITRKALSRRTFLGGALATGGLFLAGCGSDGGGAASGPSGSSSAPSGSAGSSSAPSGSAGSSSGTSTSAKQLTLKMAALPNISDGALAIGNGKGWYSDAGLEVSYAQFDNGHGAAAVEALGGGGVDLAGVGSTPALLAAAKGVVPLRIISMINNPTQTFKLYSTADISSVQDLAGKKVGYAKGSVWDYFVRELLSQADMTIDDIETADLAAADAVTAFLAGHVAAAAAPPALVKNIEDTMPDANLLFTGSDFDSDHHFGVVNPIVVTEDSMQSKHDALKTFLSVYHGKVVPYLMDDGTHGEAVQAIVDYIDDATGGQTDFDTIDTTVSAQTFYNSSDIVKFMTGDELKGILESEVKFLVDTGALDKGPDMDSLLDPSLLPQ